MNRKIPIMQLIDSLAPGGAERMAVNLSNALSRENYQVTLCATRTGGPLKNKIYPDVEYICLNRKSKISVRSLQNFHTIIKNRNIRIIHAHSSSIFLATTIKILRPKLKIVWHIHAGAYIEKNGKKLFYRIIYNFCDAIIVVTNSISTWLNHEINLNRNSIKFIPNFVDARVEETKEDLPGQKGYRIVCVANLRPEKDHNTLISAMENVIREEEHAHLLLIGEAKDQEYARSLWHLIQERNLEEKITWMGFRDDVLSIVAKCDIGVLSSKSEGFPLVLLEYGMGNLGVISTNIGECSSILDNGQGGLLVEPENSDQLSKALIQMLRNNELRNKLSKHLNDKVITQYSIETILSQYIEIYNSI